MSWIGGLILGVFAFLLAQVLWELHRKHDLLLMLGHALKVAGEWIIQKRGVEKSNRIAAFPRVTLALRVA